MFKQHILLSLLFLIALQRSSGARMRGVRPDLQNKLESRRRRVEEDIGKGKGGKGGKGSSSSPPSSSSSDFSTSPPTGDTPTGIVEDATIQPASIETGETFAPTGSFINEDGSAPTQVPTQVPTPRSGIDGEQDLPTLSPSQETISTDRPEADSNGDSTGLPTTQPIASISTMIPTGNPTMFSKGSPSPISQETAPPADADVPTIAPAGDGQTSTPEDGSSNGGDDTPTSSPANNGGGDDGNGNGNGGGDGGNSPSSSPLDNGGGGDGTGDGGNIPTSNPAGNDNGGSVPTSSPVSDGGGDGGGSIPTMSPAGNDSGGSVPTSSPVNNGGGDGGGDTPTISPAGNDNGGLVPSADTPTNPDGSNSTDPGSSALICPGRSLDRQEILTWVYSLEIDATTALTTDEILNLFELNLLSEMEDLLSCDSPAQSRRWLASDVGVNGVDHYPGDDAAIDAECSPIVDASNTCIVYNGKMNVFLDDDADLDLVHFEGRTMIKESMDRTTGSVASSGVVDATYIGPDLSDPDSLNRDGANDGQSVSSSENISFGAVIFLVLGGFIVILAFVAGYGYRRRQNQGGDLIIAALSDISALNSSDIGVADYPPSKKSSLGVGSYVPTTYQADYSEDVMNMSSILEEGDSDAASESRSDIVVSESGYSTAGDDSSTNPRQNYEHMKMLSDQPVLGAHGMVDSYDAGEDDGMILADTHTAP